ncbi:MAG TPA: hypothetical protein PL070_07890 [Flavobacteriales bacterium]|nr:hypothetical protein [Flavobacteriales bacterium]
MSHKVNLHLTAADQGTEIMLVDAYLARIRSELGELRTAVEPGVYKARFVSGGNMHDVLLDATRPGQDVVYHQPALDLHTAAPWPVERGNREQDGIEVDTNAQMVFAEQESDRVHMQLGQGSHLFLLVRDEQRPGPLSCLNSVELLAMDGTTLARLADGQHDPSRSVAGLSLILDPGNYRLRVDGGTVGSFEWCITAVSGFQTQVFQRLERFPSATGDVVTGPSQCFATYGEGEGFSAAPTGHALNGIGPTGAAAWQAGIARTDHS